MKKNRARLQILFRLHDRTGEYAVDKRRFWIKLFICIDVLLIAYGIFRSVMDSALDRAEYGSEAYYIERCENDRIERRFSELYDTLQLYQLTDKVYDPYWEVAEGYLDATLYRAYAALGDSDVITVSIVTQDGKEETFAIDAKEKADFYREKVRENAENCAFSENQSYLNHFAGK